MYSDINKVIDENKYLVYFTVKKYFSSFPIDEDVIQVGMIALWESIQNFDITKGTKFSTYACMHIQSVVAGYFRKQAAKCRVLPSGDTMIFLDELEYLDGQETKLSVLEDFNSNVVASIELKEFFSKCLSAVERMILTLKVCGYKQREIGEQVGYSQKQISRSLQQIKQKYLQF